MGEDLLVKNSLWVISLFVVLLLLFLPSFAQMNDLKARNDEYEDKIEELEKKNVYLEEELQLLRNDPVYLEKVAREKMGIVKEGEVIYKIEKIKENQE